MTIVLQQAQGYIDVFSKSTQVLPDVIAHERSKSFRSWANRARELECEQQRQYATRKGLTVRAKRLFKR
jgi:hypothetical protein